MNAFICILGLSRTQEGFEALDCAKVMDAGQTWRCLCKFLQLDLANLNLTWWSMSTKWCCIISVYCWLSFLIANNANNKATTLTFFVEDTCYTTKFCSDNESSLVICPNYSFEYTQGTAVSGVITGGELYKYSKYIFFRLHDPAPDPISCESHSPSLCSWGTV